MMVMALRPPDVTHTCWNCGADVRGSSSFYYCRPCGVIWCDTAVSHVLEQEFKDIEFIDHSKEYAPCP